MRGEVVFLLGVSLLVVFLFVLLWPRSAVIRHHRDLLLCLRRAITAVIDPHRELLLERLVCQRRRPVTAGRRELHCVVARYGESIYWMAQPRFGSVTRFFLYNKGAPLTPAERAALPPHCVVIPLPNVGRCDHTFLHHIVEHYDDADDADVVTVFVSGRGDDNDTRKRCKGPVIRFTIDCAAHTHDTVLRGRRTPDLLRAHGAFRMWAYEGENTENHIGEGASTEMLLATVRPFGAWYRQFWPTTAAAAPVTCWQSIFAVHRRHIVQHSRAYYARLRDELVGHPNPEAGHYMERAWGAVFAPVEKECIYTSSRLLSIVWP